jgi:acyl-CoA synthetase (AMP-forming)/AMP-acid ligase II
MGTILTGDCREVLKTLPDASVNCCVTSPPYWGLRDYGTAKWEGGDAGCDHKQGRNGAGRADGVIDDRGQRNRDGVGSMGGDCQKCGARRIDSQIGLEKTPEEYVAAMVAVFREVRRVLREDGTPCVADETGELVHRGALVGMGYWNDPEKTAEAIDAGGWMHTGDLATMDDEGYVNIVGRLKDLVIRGGENVYPREVEEFLYRHPKVQDVQVIGVPDPKYGEELCAWIKLRDGETASADEIREFCRGQIAHYKIPRHVRFVDGFPMTITGKVQKFVMRKETIEALGLAEQKTA